MPRYSIDTPYGTLDIDHEGDASTLQPAVEDWVKQQNSQSQSGQSQVQGVPINRADAQNLFAGQTVVNQPRYEGVQPLTEEEKNAPYKPLIEFPDISSESIKNILNFGRASTLSGQAPELPQADLGRATGIARGVQRTAQSLTSPMNAALMVATGGAPSLVQKGAALYFAGQAAKQVPEQISNAEKATDPAEKAQGYTEAALNGLIAVLAFGHANGRVREVPNLSPGASEKQINDAIRLAPEPPKNTEIPDEMLDGLVASKDAAAKAVEANPQNETLRRLNAAVARQLSDVPDERLNAARERLQQQRQSTPPAEPAAGAETAVPSEIPRNEPATEPASTQADKGTEIAAPVLVDENGKVLARGYLGQTHAELKDSIKKAALDSGDPALEEKAITALNAKHGFETDTGHIITDRQEAFQFAKNAQQIPSDTATAAERLAESGGSKPELHADQLITKKPDYKPRILDAAALGENAAQRAAAGDPAPLTGAMAELSAPEPVRTEIPFAKDAVNSPYVKAHEAALKMADDIAEQVAKGQPDTVKEAARDAAHRNAVNSIEGNRTNPQFNADFMRKSAMEAAGKAKEKMNESLDQPTGEGERTKLEETPSEAPSPDVEASRKEFAQKAVDTLSELSDREQEVVQRATMGGETFDQIAQDLGVSRQRVHQIHQAAIEKLRAKMEADGYVGGPGAMGPVEALQMAAEQKLTSIKNAVVDQARAEAGMPEREQPLSRAFGAIWDEAKRILDINPNKGRELVEELQKKTRPLTDTEDAILTHEQLDRQAAYDNAVEHVNNAATEAERAEAQAELQRARQDIYDIYDVGQKAGTENARGLNARRMMVREDYSLAKVEARARAANGGKELNEKQLADLQEAHAKIAELEKKLTEAESKGRDDLAKQYFDNLLAETKKDVKESIKQGKSVSDFLSEQAEKARQRIKSRGTRFTAGIDPVELVDYGIIGADYIAKGFTKVAEWGSEMVKDFGEKIRPYLDDIFEKSQKYHDAHQELFAKSKPKAERTPEDIAKSIDPTQPLDHQTVYDLARAHVKAGVEGFENVMKAVRDDLLEKYPDITQREVNDAFSEYGKVKFPSKEADKVKLAEYRRMGQLISAIEDVSSGKEPKKTGLQRNKPTQPVRELMVKLKDAMDEAGIDTRSSEAKLAGRLDAYKTRLKNATEDIQKRLDKGDYTKPVRSKLQLDEEAFKLKAEYERNKQKVDSEIAKIASQNRTTSQKFWDTFVGVQRAFKLSSDVVLAKLSLAAIAREAILTPAEEAVGGLLSKALPKLAGKAPREGGLSLAAEAKAKAAVFTKGMADAWQNLQMKKSDLEVTYGSKKAQPPPAWYEYLGYLHGALKAPVKRAEFARSLQKRIESALRNGEDINNPNRMLEISQEAYVDANRAIFMQDNIFSSTFNNALRMAEVSKKSPNLGPALARIGRFLVPIVKVPSNIVGETATGIHGTVTGGIRAAAAYMKGIDELPAPQADAIMRQLKKGLIGNALLLFGYFSYKSVGGFHAENDKRPDSDVQPGRYRIGGVDLPNSFGHSTGAILMNVGATIHRVEEKRGFGSGAIAGASGVAKELPAIPAISDLASALESEHGLSKYINELATSTSTPALLQHVAKLRDTPGKFPQNILTPANKRKPTNVKEAVEMGIPGLREKVPPPKRHR